MSSEMSSDKCHSILSHQDCHELDKSPNYHDLLLVFYYVPYIFLFEIDDFVTVSPYPLYLRYEYINPVHKTSSPNTDKTNN